MLLVIAIISMLLAVTAYTTAVFTERKAGILKKKHLYIFGIGVFFDGFGTTCMSLISDSFKFDIHGITGLAALLLMLGHAVFAIYIYIAGSERAKRQFHHYSLAIWLVWLIPFVSGLILNMK